MALFVGGLWVALLMLWKAMMLLGSPFSTGAVELGVHTAQQLGTLPSTLEPFLTRLHSNPNITGMIVYKIAAFSDDMLLFFTESHIPLPNLLQNLNHFQGISNLTVNYSKSQALNISLPANDEALCKANVLFVWNPAAINQLGMKLHVKLCELYQRNQQFWNPHGVN